MTLNVWKRSYLAVLVSAGVASPPAASTPDPSAPPLITAVQEQLGLKLEPQTAPIRSWSSTTPKPRPEN